MTLTFKLIKLNNVVCQEKKSSVRIDVEVFETRFEHFAINFFIFRILLNLFCPEKPGPLGQDSLLFMLL